MTFSYLESPPRTFGKLIQTSGDLSVTSYKKFCVVPSLRKPEIRASLLSPRDPELTSEPTRSCAYQLGSNPCEGKDDVNFIATLQAIGTGSFGGL